MLLDFIKWGFLPVSLFFLVGFLPFSLFIYYLLPANLRKTSILVISLFFIFFNAPQQLLIISGTIGIHLLLLSLMEKLQQRSRKRMILLLIFAYNICLWIGFALYSNGKLPYMLGGGVLPLLQIYIGVQRYRYPEKSTADFITTASQLFYYPRLYLGPLLPLTEVFESISTLPAGANVLEGFYSFLKGAGEYLLFGVGLMQLVEGIYDFYPSEISTLSSWVAVLLTCLGLFHLLAGISSMVTGISQMYHLPLARDTYTPFSQPTLEGFMKSWHKSLYDWLHKTGALTFTKTSETPVLRGLLTLASGAIFGLWFDFSLAFFLWGLLLAVGQLVEKQIGRYGKHKENHRLCSANRLFFIFVSFLILTWGFSGWDENFLASLFFSGSAPLYNLEIGYLLSSRTLILILALFFATAAPRKIGQWQKTAFPQSELYRQITACVLLFVLLLTLLV